MMRFEKDSGDSIGTVACASQSKRLCVNHKNCSRAAPAHNGLNCCVLLAPFCLSEAVLGQF
eukprot:341921-Amphidinium_carterae.1